jgi:hypothetical protein
MTKFYTVTIKNIADKTQLGKIIASPGVKIKKAELALSFNPPEGGNPIGFYLDSKREIVLKIPFRVKKSFEIFVEFINEEELCNNKENE